MNKRAKADGFTIELVGEIANVMRLSGAEDLGNEPYRSSVKVVAGARNHLNLLFNAPRLELPLWWRGCDGRAS
jgi:hypothetical protein